MKASPKSPSNLELLHTFWRRQTFHDMGVESITAINRRVIIRLDHYTLVITGVTKFTKQIDELPTSWLYEKVQVRGSDFVLSVELELGKFEVTGRDVRLISNDDMAILIPPIDA